jgi:PAS domain-containing protein
MQQQYAALLRHARDIILFIDTGSHIVEANDAALRAYGYSRAYPRSTGRRRAASAPSSLPSGSSGPT